MHVVSRESSIYNVKSCCFFAHNSYHRPCIEVKRLSPVYPQFCVKYKAGFPYSILTFYQSASGLMCFHKCDLIQ